MVMATPSPQQVGREFVRQYYTVLHEAPDVLHRFYSSGSTFVHGGVDQPDRPFEEPVVGQLEIDKKIKNLNFKDCHTKIRQVDSQLTIGSGVVVQVTGELSNNGEPMRRFMQTFVLAPQTPKKFYVHNDIFRYQDEVYQDNSDTESEDQHIEASLITKTAVLNMNNYYEQNHQQEEATGQQSTSSMSSSLPILTSPTHADQQHQQQQQIMEQADLTIQPASVEDQNGHTNGHMNTNTSMEDSNVSTNQVPVESVPVVEAQPVVLESEIPVESVNNVKEEIQAQTTETKINSWAKLVQSSGASVLENTGMLAGGNSQVYQTSQYLPSASAPKFGNKEQANTPNNNQTAGKQAKTNGGPKTNHNNKSRNQEGGRGGNQQQSQSAQQDKGQAQQQQQPREPREPKEPRVAGDEDEKKFGRYPDGQQVFVGNLNQDLSEAELRTYFSQYGKVMDMRINTNSKQQSGRRLPNYGFVVFEEKQAVENLLSASKANSITYKNDKGVEYRLNVEEKRARQGRISSGFNKQSNNRNTRSTSNGSRNGGQQQQQGGERQERPKKNNNYSQSSNTQETQGYERREGGFNNRKSDVNHDGQMVDNGPRRNNASNPRRS